MREPCEETPTEVPLSLAAAASVTCMGCLADVLPVAMIAGMGKSSRDSQCRLSLR